jgi:hypothetical protein
MFFNVQLDGGNLHYLIGIGVGVKSFQFLSTTSTGFGIMVGYALTLFYWIQGTAMASVSWLSPSLFSRWLLFLGVLNVRSV